VDLDLVQAVARVGDFVRIQQTTGHEVAGMLATLSMSHLVVDDVGTGSKHAVALSSVISVTTGQAPAPPAVPAPAAAPVVPPSPAVAPAEPAEPALTQAPYAFPRLIVPPGAASVLAQRPVSAPEFVAYADDDLLNVAVHRAALDRVRQQFDYAVRIKELDSRFGRCASMASELDGIRRAEPRSTAAFRLAGYMHGLADHAEAASDRYLSAALMVPDAPPMWWLDTAITALRAQRTELSQQALLHYFDGVLPQKDADAWWALLALCGTAGAANLLHLVRTEADPAPQVRRTVLEACHSLASAAGDVALAERAAQLLTTGAGHVVSPLPALETPKIDAVKHASAAVRPAPPKRRLQPPPVAFVSSTGTVSNARRGREVRNDYDRAKHLEQRAKDLEGAKRAYREAIRKDINAASAIKDLAWLTRRVDGPEAALRVIEDEFRDRIPPSTALDQILIDFYMGAGRYEDALRLLEPLLDTDLLLGQRNVVLRRICLARLSLSQDATSFAEQLMAMYPSDPSVRRTYAIALVRRAGRGDLDQAEEVIEPLCNSQDAQALEIAESIRQMRTGGHTAALDNLVRKLWDVRIAAITDFGQYILDNFAEAADGIRQQRKFAANDLRYLRVRGNEARGKRSRERYDSYISAAKVELEIAEGDERDAQSFFEFMVRGLTALGDTLLSTNSEVAREIYAEALAVADRLDQPATEQDYWNALVRYIRSIFDGPQALGVTHDRGGNISWSAAEVGSVIAQDLGDVPEQEIPQLFDAVDELAARTTFASESVIRGLEHNQALAARSRHHLVEYLDSTTADVAVERTIDAWRAAGRRRQSDRDEIDQQVRLLRDLEIGEVSLNRACAVLDSLHNERTFALQVDREACRKLLGHFHLLEEALKEPGFEEREFRYLKVRNALSDFADSVKASPTRLAVRNLLPIASLAAAQVERTLERLYSDREPDPLLSLALEEYTPDSAGRINVQVKLSNEPGCAPVESPELIVNLDGIGDGIEVLTAAKTAVPTVRGGESAISRIPVELSRELVASGAFTLPIAVTYRTRTRQRDISAPLAVRLTTEADFTRIAPNPFEDGASGRPVTDPDMFFGRDELVNQIVALLVGSAYPGAGVAIYGQKRAGKSSIRLHLSGRLRKSDRFLVVDIANIGRLAPTSIDVPSTHTLQILLWHILSKADLVVREQELGGGPIGLLPAGLTREQFLSSPAPVIDFISAFEQFNALAATLPGWRDRAFVVVIDEFQLIGNWIAEQRVPATFVQALKAVLEQRLFHLVVVGLDAMQSFIDRYANEFGVFAKRRVNYLAREYAFALMDLPIRIGGRDGRSRYRERAQEQIYNLTGGNPFYIQRFCFQLVEHMNHSKAPFVTEADVELVREYLLNEFGPSDFDNLETSGESSTTAIAAQAVRAVLTAVATAARDGRATLEDVERRCELPNLAAILKDLEAREVVVQESGGYRILVRLYHDWLCRRTA
jgi:tetratricopeptide (TPR) repeat protein